MATDANFSQNPVPLDKRRSNFSLVFIMLGLAFFSASMWTGGILGIGLSMGQFILALVLGNGFLALYTAILGYIGAKTGLNTNLLARFSFGVKGSWIPSLILGGTQVGWFGVGIAMFALPVSKATGLDLNLVIILAGILMTTNVFFGIAGLSVISMIAVPSIALLGGYSVWLAIKNMGGWAAFAQTVPTEPVSLYAAIAMVIGSFISVGTLTADFIRFGKKAAIAIVCCFVAFFLGNSLMFFFGAAGSVSEGVSDISEVMMKQGLLIPAILVLGLNIWTTNDNALYASGLAFSNITRLPSRWLSLANGVLGTIAGLWLYNNFVGWLTFLSSAIPPIGGIIITDYLLAKKSYHEFAQAEFRSVNWSAMIALAAGALAGLLSPGIPPLNAILTASLTYAGLKLALAQFFVRAAMNEGE